MRVYKVDLEYEKIIIHADEIKFKNDFRNKTTDESLVFFVGDRLVAIFKNWKSIIDLGEYLPLQVTEE